MFFRLPAALDTARPSAVMSANLRFSMVLLGVRNGFSAVELVIAMALMGILAAIAFTSWTRLLPTYSLNNSIRQIQSELHNIKMRAVAEGVAFQMAYSQGASAYTIKREMKTVLAKPIADGTVITKDGVISFSPQGTAGANRVRVRNATGVCKQIVVSATGRVRICAPSTCADDC
jgi:prepilin-type N-terminal cleavage/methylation domain-containing protein